MIICGFAGIGKSYLGKTYPRFMDLESTPFEKDFDRYAKCAIHYSNQGYCVLVSCHLELSKVLAYLEKQKEQKPIFKKGDKVIWDDEEFNILDVNETEYNVGGYRVPFSRQNELHPIWQKSAEWSEEDEEMLNSCISSIEEAKENRYAYKETDGDTSYDHEIAWLKSLRNRVGKEFLQPHWKPSEEQIEAIENVIKCELSAGLHTRANILQTLQNELKKL